MKKEIKELTRAELQIMQILWDLETAFVHDIIDRMDEPKPAYSTVSTFVRILETKGFIGHKAYGKTHQYFPLISRADCTGTFMNSVMNNFFDNSFSSMVSFFAKRENLTTEKMDQIIHILKESVAEKQEV